MNDHVVKTLEDGILTLRLNRPDRLNAWNGEMRQIVRDAFAEANHAAAVRAIILTGTGDRAFCAGQDLNEAKSFDAAIADRWIEGFKDFYNTLRRFEKPYVAALNGLAAGSAFQVSLLADYRVGHADSRMGQPEINSGILSITGFWVIREHLGLARATELVLTGRLVPAPECREIGILNEIVAREEVQAPPPASPTAARETRRWPSARSSAGMRMSRWAVCRPRSSTCSARRRPSTATRRRPLPVSTSCVDTTRRSVASIWVTSTGTSNSIAP